MQSWQSFSNIGMREKPDLNISARVDAFKRSEAERVNTLWTGVMTSIT